MWKTGGRRPRRTKTRMDGPGRRSPYHNMSRLETGVKNCKVLMRNLTGPALYLLCSDRSPVRTSSVSPACRKRRLNGAVCRNHRIKRVVSCKRRKGTLKNLTKCLWRKEPDRRYNFFDSPPAGLCRHIYD